MVIVTTFENWPLYDKYSDNNGNSDDIYSEPMPADLIDVIGPAPDNSKKTSKNSTKMVMDNISDSVYADFLGQDVITDTYSSLQRGSSRVCQIIHYFHNPTVALHTEHHQP